MAAPWSSRNPVMALSKHNTEAYTNAMTHLNLALGVFRNLKIGKFSTTRGRYAIIESHAMTSALPKWQFTTGMTLLVTLTSQKDEAFCQQLKLSIPPLSKYIRSYSKCLLGDCLGQCYL
ncbi:hypothetical protein HOLleu_06333 [Holothuria leucospilota]|uniref:Uncharacterized protein n=1 Tax=Holothuria leucospilota TaxID=206669 RepID=A0A9Q1HF33_HOLLE|nr:hypothetical protein HOLleu_06333 [Holothuria leucospilota]